MKLRRLKIFLVCLTFAFQAKGQIVKQRPVTLMGSRFDMTIIADTHSTADYYIDSLVSEISRIEELISDWKPSSQISEINRNAGIRPVKVDREVFDLTERSLYFSRLTNGAFDISYAAMDKVWKFDGSMKTMPSAEDIEKSIAKVGYRNIVLDSAECTIFLKLKGMKIGFGAMGKGYAADRGRELMEDKGVKAGIVNASGDMATWGTNIKGKAWRVGVTHPFDEQKFITVLKLKRQAVTTSGNYEKYVEFEGKRYSHIINPVTGYPAVGLVSVTVVGPSAEMANGFSTSIMVLGAEKGLELIRKFPEYSCFMITDQGSILKSENFKGRLKKRLK